MKKILNNVILAALLAACTDYVAEIDEREGEWETAEVTSGTMTDSRDGQTYKTVTIGTQTWMAQNLNYETANSYCYDDNVSNCTKYGRLYTWEVATTVCPEGWHLPTKAEFETLFTAVGGQSIEVLKSTSGWNSSDNGTDAFAFSALPAGYRYDDGDYYGEGFLAYFWSSTEINSGVAYFMNLLYDFDDADLYNYNKNFGFSVRCLKDEGETVQSSSSVTPQSNNSETSVSSSSSAESSSSVTLATPCKTETEDNCEYGELVDDRDGQTYKTVSIGTQTWMAQNLNYESEGSYCYKDSAEHCTKYGRLYTWAAAMDSVGTLSTNGKGCGFGTTCSPTYPVRGICPEGWHLPTKAEFETLFTAVGGQSTAGKVIKSTSGWNSSGNGTDAFAFSALPAGSRNNFGDYYNEGNLAYFWSSTEYGSDNAYYMYLDYYLGNAVQLTYEDHGFSVRCVKDTQAE